jgi:hypothetical protein
MPRGTFKTLPDSLRQRLLAQIPYEGSRSSTSILDAAGVYGTRDRMNACSTLGDLRDDGFVEVVGFGQGERTPASKGVRLYRRLSEPETVSRRQLAKARKVIEAAGYVVTRRAA